MSKLLETILCVTDISVFYLETINQKNFGEPINVGSNNEFKNRKYS